jgi:hypothetical protein
LAGPAHVDVPVVVVTHQVPRDWVDAHPDAPFFFVTDGVPAAIARAQEIAGDRVVSVSGGTIARQCLDLGLLDEVAVDLVPVIMGAGNRPFFGRLSYGRPTRQPIRMHPGRPSDPFGLPGSAVTRPSDLPDRLGQPRAWFIDAGSLDSLVVMLLQERIDARPPHQDQPRSASCCSS